MCAWSTPNAETGGGQRGRAAATEPPAGDADLPPPLCERSAADLRRLMTDGGGAFVGGGDDDDDDPDDAVTPPSDWRRVDADRQRIEPGEHATLRGPDVARPLDDPDRDGWATYYTTAQLTYDYERQQWLAELYYVDADTFDRERVASNRVGSWAFAVEWLVGLLTDWRPDGETVLANSPEYAGSGALDADRSRNPRHREWRDRAEQRGWEVRVDDYPNQRIEIDGDATPRSGRLVEYDVDRWLLTIRVDGTRDLAYHIDVLGVDTDRSGDSRIVTDVTWSSTTYPDFDTARGMALLEAAETTPTEVLRSITGESQGGYDDGPGGGGHRGP
jgi:hypothetical protein